ncbi:hypothetical protein FOQG_10365 [Fusarium oxysporum f. sp. raphani 54005]|uniref:Plastocyanin-like domain-containing protein n=2 Tax=Fusarium oxysporum TaxID=5507 RepID=X0BTS0_FUSOX|nr:hypothetical protein FOMG_18906 [Fusarium oxysporum f. sp. melonis 26406]EXK25003.1 hypothetical protein FOMG_18319 [Fusarium oxysporum f. sp. melonis 26406]EXK85570.1 hypothetical protein FOQG_10365 [Fusarium oxysporum f. sp. raphani 54005]
MIINWGILTLLQAYEDQGPWSSPYNIIELDEGNKRAYMLVHSPFPVNHSVHLHGHDFFVLAQGDGVYIPGITEVNLINPPRRETAMLPAAGYLLLALETDNAGISLMHYHLGCHTTGGLDLQFVERKREIPKLVGYNLLNETCAKWNS